MSRSISVRLPINLLQTLRYEFLIWQFFTLITTHQFDIALLVIFRPNGSTCTGKFKDVNTLQNLWASGEWPAMRFHFRRLVEFVQFQINKKILYQFQLAIMKALYMAIWWCKEHCHPCQHTIQHVALIQSCHPPPPLFL